MPGPYATAALRRQIRPRLAEDVLAPDLAAAEAEQIDAVDLDPAAVGGGAGEGPFGDAEVAVDEMLAPRPLRIGHARPRRGERLAHRVAADVARAAGVVAGGGQEHAVVAHEGHQRVDVVAVPGGAESGEGFDGDRWGRGIQFGLLHRPGWLGRSSVVTIGELG